MGFRDYFASKWAADRLSRTAWVVLAVLGALVAVLMATVLSNLAARVALTVLWAAYSLICIVQAIRTRRR